jgi:hypothetical protein
MEKVLIEFTLQEIQSTLQLVHIATLARGLDVADEACAIKRKFMLAMQEASEMKPNGHDVIGKDVR